VTRRSWRHASLLVGGFLLACAHDSLVSTSGGNGTDGGGQPPALKPATFSASVNPTLPAGYSLSGETPYRWQAYLYYDGAWVALANPQATSEPTTVLMIDCNDPAIHDACTLHLSAMIQVTITNVEPGPTLLCGYKSGFQFRDDFLLNTPVGNLSVAPAASSSQDPLNQGSCFP